MATFALDDINKMNLQAFVAALGDVFEHAPWIAEAAYEKRPFSTLNALYEAMTEAVRNAEKNRQIAFIRGHPDLAGKAAREGSMTDDSKAEQASAGLDRLTEDEFAKFHKLNDAYVEKFG